MARLLNPPQLHLGEGHERKPTWLELFYDLVYVATFVQLGNRLSDNVSLTGFLLFFLLFAPIWLSWIGTTFYSNRFDPDDVFHRILVMLQMFTVVVMAINVYDAFGSSGGGFAAGYAMNRFILVVMYIRAGRHIERARPLTRVYATGFAIAASLWVVSIFVPPPFRFVLWGVAMVIDFVSPSLAGQINYELAPSPHHLVERFALLTIIVFGESFLKVIGGLAGEEQSISDLFLDFPSLIVAFSLWWIYFDHAAESTPRVSVIRRWIYTHLPYQMGVTALGVGVYKVATADAGYALYDSYRWLVCGMVALVLVATATIESTTNLHTRVNTKMILRFVSAGLVILIAAFGAGVNAALMLGLVAVICAGQVAFDLYERSRRDEDTLVDVSAAIPGD